VSDKKQLHYISILP